MQRKSAGLTGQIIIKIKNRSKRLPLSSQPDILVIGALADDGLDKGSSIETDEVKDNGTANHDADIVIDGSDDVVVNKDPSH